MRPTTVRRLGPRMGLLLVVVVHGCGDPDALITVGVRPTDEPAAAGAATAGNMGGLPTPGHDQQAHQNDPQINPRESDAGAAAGQAGLLGGAAGTGQAAGIADAGAGTGGPRDPGEDACGAIPLQPASQASSSRIGSPGRVEYAIAAPNTFTRLRTTLAVPTEPPPDGHIFIWPGIQPAPEGAKFQPIGNGALLSVLTWGPSCTTDSPASYSTWWIAPMYTNLSSTDPQYAGCHNGDIVLTAPQELLDIDIQLEGTTWVQRVLNRSSLERSEFQLDLDGQEQGRVFFALGLQTANKPTEDILFTNTVLSMDLPHRGACQPVVRGANDFASAPRVSADERHCCIDRIALRAPGVAATTMDPR